MTPESVVVSSVVDAYEQCLGVEASVLRARRKLERVGHAAQLVQQRAHARGQAFSAGVAVHSADDDPQIIKQLCWRERSRGCCAAAVSSRCCAAAVSSRCSAAACGTPRRADTRLAANSATVASTATVQRRETDGLT